jgi:hypothetical protein
MMITVTEVAASSVYSIRACRRVGLLREKDATSNSVDRKTLLYSHLCLTIPPEMTMNSA